MLPVIDAHHHVWRQADLAWLQGPMQPRIFGPYEPLRRDYPMREFLDDLAGCGVVGSVYVQANWPAAGALDEVRWVQSVADETGWPHAIVGYADMLSENIEPLVREQSRSGRFRGVRMQMHWHQNELYRFAASPDLADDARLRRNVRVLAAHGLSFDLQVFASQMAGAARLARDNPEVTFVLQHAGMLEDLSASGIAAWQAGLRQLADQPNVVVKLSAFGTFIHRNDAAHIAFIVRETLALFGARRCLFGSNFPIEKLWTRYPDLLAAHRAAVAGLPEADQRAVLHDTALRVYRIHPDTLTPT